MPVLRVNHRLLYPSHHSVLRVQDSDSGLKRSFIKQCQYLRGFWISPVSWQCHAVMCTYHPTYMPLAHLTGRTAQTRWTVVIKLIKPVKISAYDIARIPALWKSTVEMFFQPFYFGKDTGLGSFWIIDTVGYFKVLSSRTDFCSIHDLVLASSSFSSIPVIFSDFFAFTD